MKRVFISQILNFEMNFLWWGKCDIDVSDSSNEGTVERIILFFCPMECESRKARYGMVHTLRIHQFYCKDKYPYNFSQSIRVDIWWLYNQSLYGISSSTRNSWPSSFCPRKPPRFLCCRFFDWWTCSCGCLKYHSVTNRFRRITSKICMNTLKILR